MLGQSYILDLIEKKRVTQVNISYLDYNFLITGHLHFLLQHLVAHTGVPALNKSVLKYMQLKLFIR